MARFAITVHTAAPGTERNEYPDPGAAREVSGETLEELSGALAAMGYQGGSVLVRDEAGFLAGFVSASDWQAALRAGPIPRKAGIMISYQPDGIHSRSTISRDRDRIVPWDSVRVVRLRSGETVTRHQVVLRGEHFPLIVPGNGVGGFRCGRDCGRTLTVDRLADGRVIDTLG